MASSSPSSTPFPSSFISWRTPSKASIFSITISIILLTLSASIPIASSEKILIKNPPPLANSTWSWSPFLQAFVIVGGSFPDMGPGDDMDSNGNSFTGNNGTVEEADWEISANSDGGVLFLATNHAVDPPKLAWYRETELNAPQTVGLQGHSAHVIADDKILILFGASAGKTAINDSTPLSAHYAGILNLRDNTFTQLETKGQIPSPRYHHAAAYDPVTNRAFVFGGAVLPNMLESSMFPNIVPVDPSQPVPPPGIGPSSPGVIATPGPPVPKTEKKKDDKKKTSNPKKKTSKDNKKKTTQNKSSTKKTSSTTATGSKNLKGNSTTTSSANRLSTTLSKPATTGAVASPAGGKAKRASVPASNITSNNKPTTTSSPAKSQSGTVPKPTTPVPPKPSSSTVPPKPPTTGGKSSTGSPNPNTSKKSTASPTSAKPSTSTASKPNPNPSVSIGTKVTTQVVDVNGTPTTSTITSTFTVTIAPLPVGTGKPTLFAVDTDVHVLDLNTNSWSTVKSDSKTNYWAPNGIVNMAFEFYGDISSDPPNPREGARLTTDINKKRMYLFGGWDPTTGLHPDNVWYLDVAVLPQLLWRPIPTSDTLISTTQVKKREKAVKLLNAGIKRTLSGIRGGGVGNGFDAGRTEKLMEGLGNVVEEEERKEEERNRTMVGRVVKGVEGLGTSIRMFFTGAGGKKDEEIEVEKKVEELKPVGYWEVTREQEEYNGGEEEGEGDDEEEDDQHEVEETEEKVERRDENDFGINLDTPPTDSVTAPAVASASPTDRGASEAPEPTRMNAPPMAPPGDDPRVPASVDDSAPASTPSPDAPMPMNAPPVRPDDSGPGRSNEVTNNDSPKFDVNSNNRNSDGGNNGTDSSTPTPNDDPYPDAQPSDGNGDGSGDGSGNNGGDGGGGDSSNSSTSNTSNQADQPVVSITPPPCGRAYPAAVTVDGVFVMWGGEQFVSNAFAGMVTSKSSDFITRKKGNESSLVDPATGSIIGAMGGVSSKWHVLTVDDDNTGTWLDGWFPGLKLGSSASGVPSVSGGGSGGGTSGGTTDGAGGGDGDQGSNKFRVAFDIAIGMIAVGVMSVLVAVITVTAVRRRRRRAAAAGEGKDGDEDEGNRKKEGFRMIFRGLPGASGMRKRNNASKLMMPRSPERAAVSEKTKRGSPNGKSPLTPSPETATIPSPPALVDLHGFVPDSPTSVGSTLIAPLSRVGQDSPPNYRFYETSLYSSVDTRTQNTPANEPLPGPPNSAGSKNAARYSQSSLHSKHSVGSESSWQAGMEPPPLRRRSVLDYILQRSNSKDSKESKGSSSRKKKESFADAAWQEAWGNAYSSSGVVEDAGAEIETDDAAFASWAYGHAAGFRAAVSMSEEFRQSLFSQSSRLSNLFAQALTTANLPRSGTPPPFYNTMGSAKSSGSVRSSMAPSGSFPAFMPVAGGRSSTPVPPPGTPEADDAAFDRWAWGEAAAIIASGRPGTPLDLEAMGFGNGSPRQSLVRPGTPQSTGSRPGSVVPGAARSSIPEFLAKATWWQQQQQAVYGRKSVDVEQQNMADMDAFFAGVGAGGGDGDDDCDDGGFHAWAYGYAAGLAAGAQALSDQSEDRSLQRITMSSSRSNASPLLRQIGKRQSGSSVATSHQTLSSRGSHPSSSGSRRMFASSPFGSPPTPPKPPHLRARARLGGAIKEE
ncbi:hypothetical protein HDU97_005107 [Phlyctochytrium planicorne]|nr:hypothetical protein HDU97_005107 [Phlyctochytrium planicorne]